MTKRIQVFAEEEWAVFGISALVGRGYIVTATPYKPELEFPRPNLVLVQYRKRGKDRPFLEDDLALTSEIVDEIGSLRTLLLVLSRDNNELHSAIRLLEDKRLGAYQTRLINYDKDDFLAQIRSLIGNAD